MGLKQFSPPEDQRFICYYPFVYKFQIYFSENITCDTITNYQEDIELAIHHILIGVPKDVKKIQTNTVAVKYRTRKWCCDGASFACDGKQLLPFPESYKLYISFNSKDSLLDEPEETENLSALDRSFVSSIVSDTPSSTANGLHVMKDINVDTCTPLLPSVSVASRLKRQRRNPLLNTNSTDDVQLATDESDRPSKRRRVCQRSKSSCEKENLLQDSCEEAASDSSHLSEQKAATEARSIASLVDQNASVALDSNTSAAPDQNCIIL